MFFGTIWSSSLPPILSAPRCLLCPFFGSRLLIGHVCSIDCGALLGCFGCSVGFAVIGWWLTLARLVRVMARFVVCPMMAPGFSSLASTMGRWSCGVIRRSVVPFVGSLVGFDGWSMAQFTTMTTVMLPRLLDITFAGSLMLLVSVVGLVLCWWRWAPASGLLVQYAKHSDHIRFVDQYCTNNELSLQY
jgi:hypothetical protein